MEIALRQGARAVADADTSREDRALSKAKRINEWVIVAAGILGILVTILSIFGYNQSNAKDQATSNAEDLQRELDAANRAIGDLRSDNNQLQQDLSAVQADNEKLQSENQSLREQLDAAGVTPSGAPSPPSEISGPVRHSGEVTIAEDGDRIDLNAPSTDPLWAGDGWQTQDYAELSQRQVVLWYVDSLPLDNGKTADYETCSKNSGYAGGSGGTLELDPSSLRGDQCFRLASGRFASITFVSGDAERVTLAITTWEKE
jgi:hypothetical protein